jgi:hypothetical protein
MEHLMHKPTSTTLLLLSLTLAACGGSDEGSQTTTDTKPTESAATPPAAPPPATTSAPTTTTPTPPPPAPTGAPKLTGTIGVPASFAGKPAKLLVAAFSKLPVAGPPDGGILAQINAPTVGPNATVPLDIDISTMKGSYYVLAVLYVQGGGTFSPKAGVDYDVATSKAIAFDGKTPVDVGTLVLALHQTGDGH